MLSPRTPFSSYAVATNSGESSEIARIPIKILMNYARNQDFRESYNIPDNPTPTDIYDIFNSNNIRVLIQRMPGHQRDEISSFIAKPWNNKTIGVNGAVMAIKNGDFDGDTLFAYFPIAKGAKDDLLKLKIEDILYKANPSKAIKDLNIADNDMIEAIRDAYFISTGDSEVIEQTDHKDKYYQYGNEAIDYLEEQAKAADEFLYIKQGTASAGGIGNALRHLMYHHFGTKGIEVANRIYHGLAQSALDCKSSSDNREILDEVFVMLRSIRDPKYLKLKNNLKVFIDEEAISYLMNLLYDGERWRGGVSVISGEDTPFSQLIHNGGMAYLYKSITHSDEKSVAKYLYNLD
jgi:hypothetical protein